MRVKQFLVFPKLPDKIRPLQEMSHNIWYSWNWEITKLFIRLDAETWEDCDQNPVQMLSQLSQETLERAAADDGFVASLNRVYQKYQDYLSRKNWFSYDFPDKVEHKIAYFSLEYGLDTGLPVYSGGLGVLSGDTLKSASDLGIPIVAVGLLYRYGYFRQYLSSDGWQQEKYVENDWYHMPVVPVKDEQGHSRKVTVDFLGTPVHIQIWKVSVGNVPLYLLDTNIPENPTKFREITSVLYGGDKDMRIRQEIILGIGGVKALRALGIEPSIYHMNEGHSWFLTLERIRLLMDEKNLSFSEASQYIWSTTIFTTHTPVPAGNEKFDAVLVKRYLESFVSKLGIGWEQFINIGKVFAGDKDELFCMTVAALRNSAFANGVSKLHGKISREMWHHIWPELPIDEVPIKSVTNGVHPRSWVSHDMDELYESYFGANYRNKPHVLNAWKNIEKIPDTELWRIHNRRRERLVFFARKRLKKQLQRSGASHIEIHKADQILDPQILTICFARRFSTYKRGNLIFSDLKRLLKLINNDKFPLQIILAGKAHPLDNPGKEIIKEIYHYTKDERFQNRVIFLEDYDINVAKYLVQGADVWLNNPRRPLEASGTSGMKAALNGVLNLSILDGWWCEGYADETGFKIGNGEEYDNNEVQDHLEAEMLYNTIEKEVVPLFYKTDNNNIPIDWIKKMKAAISMAGKDFSSHRMLVDYTQKFYIPGIEASIKLRQNNMELTKSVTQWVEKISQSWASIHIKDVQIPEMENTIYVGQTFPIKIFIALGDINPNDVSVEIISGKLDSQEQIHNYKPTMAVLSEQNESDQVSVFSGEVICRESGRFGITVRIIPNNENLLHTFKPKLIQWW